MSVLLGEAVHRVALQVQVAVHDQPLVELGVQFLDDLDEASELAQVLLQVEPDALEVSEDDARAVFPEVFGYELADGRVLVGDARLLVVHRRDDVFDLVEVHLLRRLTLEFVGLDFDELDRAEAAGEVVVLRVLEHEVQVVDDVRVDLLEVVELGQPHRVDQRLLQMLLRVDVDVGDVPQHDPAVQVLDDVDHVVLRGELALDRLVVLWSVYSGS